MAGFEFSHRLCGAAPTLRELKPKGGVTAMAVGDLINVETGLADISATADAALAGVLVAPGRKSDGSGDTNLASIGANDTVMVIVDDDAVYKVADANARVLGATLDISGGTGAQTVAATSNADLVVVAPSSATQPTLVKIARSQHVLMVS